MKRNTQTRHLTILLIIFFIILVWSVIRPKDYFLWILEIAPALIGVGLCIYFYRRLAFTTTTYVWCFIAAVIMAVGAHYSYSEVPGLDIFKEIFGYERNNYDKLGHIVQGVVPVLISLEVILRKQIVKTLRWTNFFALCVAVSVAAFYELIEWLAIAFSSDVTENFLGMQGYFWDAQSDIFFALLGAAGALLFSKRMERAINMRS